MTLKQQKKRIFRALKVKTRSRTLARLIRNCRNHQPCMLCGDLCPEKTYAWLQQLEDKVVQLLNGSPKPLMKVIITRDDWTRDVGALAGKNSASAADALDKFGKPRPALSQGAIEKALRRAFDELRLPGLVAIGISDAWHDGERWEIGAACIVAGASRRQLLEALPLGKRKIASISDSLKGLRALVRGSQCAKWAYPIGDLLSNRLHQREYYEWLASLTPNGRMFRYGCDRHFNPLKKTVKPLDVRLPKPRPYPKHLTKYMFGNHDPKCNCQACGGLGKRGS